jgi:hypothetical protein
VRTEDNTYYDDDDLFGKGRTMIDFFMVVSDTVDPCFEEIGSLVCK